MMRRGFTLVELATSLTIAAIIVTALGSTLVVATRALPSADSALARAAAVGELLARMADEITYATGMTLATDTSIEFTMDRDGTTVTVRYAWGGKAGDPVTRTEDGIVETVLDGAEDFAFAYDAGQVTAAGVISEITDYVEGVLDLDAVVTPLSNLAQVFPTNLDAGTMSWDVTNVRLRARWFLLIDGSTTVELRDVKSGEPGDTVLASTTLAESTLPATYDWVDVPLSASGLHPMSEAAIVLRCASGLAPMAIQVDTNGTGTGGSWQKPGDEWKKLDGPLALEVAGRVSGGGAATGGIRGVSIAITPIGGDTAQYTGAALAQPIVDTVDAVKALLP